MSEVTSHLQMAVCRLLLRGDQWMPLALTAELTGKHRSSPCGPIIMATFLAAVAGTRIVGWEKPSFTVLDMGPDGTPDIEKGMRHMAETLGAERRDHEAQDAGAVGINSKLMERRRDEEEERIPMQLRRAALDLAASNITEKLRGRRVRGVTLVHQTVPPKTTDHQLPENGHGN